MYRRLAADNAAAFWGPQICIAGRSQPGLSSICKRVRVRAEMYTARRLVHACASMF